MSSLPGCCGTGRSVVAGKVYQNEKIVGAPTLLAHVNEKIGVKVVEGDDPFALSMVVAPQP